MENDPEANGYVSPNFSYTSASQEFAIQEGCSVDGNHYREDSIQWYNPNNPNHVKPSWK